MLSEIFLSAIKKLTEQNLTLVDLIEAGYRLRGEGKSDQVIQLYKLWIHYNGDSHLLFAAYFNYGMVLSESGKFEEAKGALQQAIALKPDFSPAYINLGGILERMGAVGEAVTQWVALVNRLESVTYEALKHKITALNQIGRILEINDHPLKAEQYLRQSLEIDHNQPEVMSHFMAIRFRECEWPVVAPWEGVDRKNIMTGVSPLSMSLYTDDPILHLASGWYYNKSCVGYPLSNYQKYTRAKDVKTRSDRRRIGYLSSDLRNHAVGFIMAEVFELHNRDQFEIFIYYCGITASDSLKERIASSVEHWVDVRGFDDETLAKRIAEDDIDILIDLNGYTRDARTNAIALRPAPIIVNWLGYPGSMGSPYHHYIIADDWIIPQDHEIYYSEKVMRLPCYQPNDLKRAISTAIPTRESVNLPDNAFVYCCFNGIQKINRFMFERWVSILKQVPESVLWLLSRSDTGNARLKGYAQEQGISPDRIIIAPFDENNSEHLTRYMLADLFLDTSPYGAHVTGSDALWMGLPILTISGRSFASRVCGSLVRSAGLPELVCRTPEEYVEMAVALGRDKERVLKLKQKLKDNRDTCVLFDSKSCVKNLESLYQQMWKDFSQGKLPRPDLTNLDVYFEIGCEENYDEVEYLTVQDYVGRYKSKMLNRHRYYRLGADSRLWTAEDIADADCESIGGETEIKKPRQYKIVSK
jgi:predicted O-linked N-acetylglucosamine transferase (SPINDLY family)